MVRKSRSDKKDTTCKRCGRVCANPNKLREHLRRKNPCRPLSEITASIQVPIQVPIQTPIQEVIQNPTQIPVQVPTTVAINDIPFKNPKIEWEYQNLKRRLGKFANLRQECCDPEEFDRVRFYSEMEKVSKNTKGMFHSPWPGFVHEAIHVLQRYFGNIDKKEAIAKLRKEIY